MAFVSPYSNWEEFGVSSFFLTHVGRIWCQFIFLDSRWGFRSTRDPWDVYRAIDDELVYRALNRGNNRGDVFADDADHLAFLRAIADARSVIPFASSAIA
jgi:hypothetical protein